MKFIQRVSIIIFLFIFCHGFVLTQNEFGTVDSYWKYNYEHHSGDGSGWTMIKIVKDTLIEGVEYKKYRWTHYYRSFMGEEYEQSQHGLLLIENDSVYLEDQFILDLDMEITDSLFVDIEAGFLAMQLAIDSISVQEIDGVEYKKWFGQKLCNIDGFIDDPYEDFTFLESVGPIVNGYLFWNFDGCLIGGGSNRFVCYKNGDFTYPPGQDCQESFLSNTEDQLSKAEINIFPNPSCEILNLDFGDMEVNALELLSLDGQIIEKLAINRQVQTLDISELSSGLYLLRVLFEEGINLTRFVKE